MLTGDKRTTVEAVSASWAAFSHRQGAPTVAGGRAQYLAEPVLRLLSPIIAATAMALSSVSVNGNALRLRTFRMYPCPCESFCPCPNSLFALWKGKCNVLRTMRLINRSRHRSNFVRAVSPAGDWFVGSVVACMLMVSLGDAVDPALLSEIGLEFGLFDLGGELSVLAARHWHLLQMLLAGGLLVGGVAWLRACNRLAFKVLRSAAGEGIDKVPI